ncbi:MAG: hypothetical protein J6W00_07605 [Lentisphaeria bacterium]|nr:hypothetical protein [Lentisphaeria bacterium]
MNDDFDIDDIQLVKRSAPAPKTAAAKPSPEISAEAGEIPELSLTKKNIPAVKTPSASAPLPAAEPVPGPPPVPVQTMTAPPQAPEIKIPAKKVPQINIPANAKLKKPEPAVEKAAVIPEFDIQEVDISVKPPPPPPPPQQQKRGKATPPKAGKGKSLMPGDRTAPTAEKAKISEFQSRNYGVGCCIFAFVVPLLAGAVIAAAIRYWEPLREQLSKFETWMSDKGLAFDGGDAPWKHQSENKGTKP